PRRWHPQRGRGPIDPLADLLDLAERALARHRFDAAYARADRLFFRDEEQPDVAGAVAVRAAAQLARRTGLHDADLVPVLFVEEVHRARSERVLQRHRL